MSTSSTRMSGAESRDVTKALGEARRRTSDLDRRAIDLLRDVLLFSSYPEVRRDDMNLTFVMRFQQMTGVVMVKGIEVNAVVSIVAGGSFRGDLAG